MPDFELEDALLTGRIGAYPTRICRAADFHVCALPSRQFLPEKTRAVVEFLIHESQVG